ncbi:hypothetical protein Q9L58_010400, partial [Maublancomyces gigas]
MDSAHEPSRGGISFSCAVARCRALSIACSRAPPQQTDPTPKTIYPQLQLVSRNPFGSDPARRLRLPAVACNGMYYTAQWCCPYGCNRTPRTVSRRERSGPRENAAAADVTWDYRYPLALVGGSSSVHGGNKLMTDPPSDLGVIPGLSFLCGSFPRALRGGGWEDRLLGGDTGVGRIGDGGDGGGGGDGVFGDVGQETSTPVIGLRDAPTPTTGLQGVSAVETPALVVGLQGVGAGGTFSPVVGLQGVGVVETSPLTPPSVVGLRGVGDVGTSASKIGLRDVDVVGTPIIGPTSGVNAFGTSPLTPPSMVGLHGVNAVETSTPVVGLH